MKPPPVYCTAQLTGFPAHRCQHRAVYTDGRGGFFCRKHAKPPGVHPRGTILPGLSPLSEKP